MRRLLPLRILIAPLLLLLLLPIGVIRAQSFCDYAPGVSVSATRGAVGVTVYVQVTASDPNGDAITSLTADTSALPPGNNAIFTVNASNTAGTLTWTPQAGQTGNFTVACTASNALSGTASGTINVVDTAGAPFVQCPANVTASEGQLVTFDVFAADPDGEPIASLTASPLPPGATFTADPTNTMGTFSWQTGFTSAGSYNVTFTAANSLTGSSTTGILIGNFDRAPVVYAPLTATGVEGSLLTICVLASDPDGDAIVSLTASQLPAGATFTSSASHQVGTFQWTPAPGQAGTYNVTFTASNALSASVTTAITVNNVELAPAVVAPATQTGTATILLTFTVSASDPDGPAITSLTAAGTAITAGAAFTSNASNTSGTFSWTPSFTQAGSYSVTFTASNWLSGSATTQITIDPAGDRSPVVTAPATASGSENSLLTFGVSASDADGDAITSLTAAPLPAGATFTAGPGNTSGTLNWTPATGQAGTYFVSFVASNALTGSATTTISVTAVLPARVFTTGTNKTIRLGSNRPLWCADIEPVGGDFAVTDVLPSSVVMISPGTGSVGQISAVRGKTSVVGDQDNNRIADIEICFLKGDLRQLFSNLTGKQTVTVTLEGRLVTGARFRGTLTVDVNAGGGGGALAAAITPNPPTRESTLHFSTTRGGAVRVRVFDVGGRLVRSLVEDSYRAAGAHAVPFDGRGDDGRRLPSGIYLFRIEAPEGIATGRIAVLR